jgi:hypothetical protein
MPPLLHLSVPLMRVANFTQFTQALQANLEQDKAVKVEESRFPFHAPGPNVTAMQVAQFFGSHGISL